LARLVPFDRVNRATCRVLTDRSVARIQQQTCCQYRKLL